MKFKVRQKKFGKDIHDIFRKRMKYSITLQALLKTDYYENAAKNVYFKLMNSLLGKLKLQSKITEFVKSIETIQSKLMW